MAILVVLLGVAVGLLIAMISERSYKAIKDKAVPMALIAYPPTTKEDTATAWEVVN